MACSPRDTNRFRDPRWTITMNRQLVAHETAPAAPPTPTRSPGRAPYSMSAAVQAGFRDPEVPGDLRQRRLALAGHGHHVTAELDREAMH